MDRKKCNRCKVTLPESDFKVKRNGDLYKQCKRCIEYQAQFRANRCEHGKIKYICKECGGSSICEHNKRRNRCRLCKGVGICEHSKQKGSCKECGGSQICEHDRIRSQCKECKGGSICEHDKHKSSCRECGGSAFCEHDRQKSRCRECGGSAFCEHDRIRSRCKECHGGSICEHDRRRYLCHICKGGGICKHDKERHRCKECDLGGYLLNIVRSQVYTALKREKKLSSKEYIGCEIDELKEHIENQFKSGMSWDNYGEWHIDHIIPVKYKKPSLEEIIERLHYTNLQPLWAADNLSKGNRYVG